VLRKRVAPFREIPADREQHGNATANTLGWIGKAVGVEIQTLFAAAHPTGDKASSVRNNTQLIAISGNKTVMIGAH
jgi:hypothetical protein